VISVCHVGFAGKNEKFVASG